MSVGLWLQEIWLDSGCPDPRRMDRDGARPAFAARKNPDQYIFNPSEILSHRSAEVGALVWWPWRNAVQWLCSLCHRSQGIPTGHAAVQPVGSSSAQDPGLWMWTVTDTCPLSLLGFLPQYFHGTPKQGADGHRHCFSRPSLHGSRSTCLGRNLRNPKPWQKEPSPPWQNSQAGFAVYWGIVSVSKDQVLPAHSLYVSVYF